MVQRNCQFRSTAPDCRFRATQRAELAPFNIHLDKINARDLVANDNLVNSRHWHPGRDDARTWIDPIVFRQWGYIVPNVRESRRIDGHARGKSRVQILRLPDDCTMLRQGIEHVDMS